MQDVQLGCNSAPHSFARWLLDAITARTAWPEAARVDAHRANTAAVHGEAYVVNVRVNVNVRNCVVVLGIRMSPGTHAMRRAFQKNVK